MEELGQFDDTPVRWEAQGTSDLLTGDRIAGSSERRYPVIVWWSPLTGEQGRLAECGSHRCFFTVNRSYHAHPSTEAFLFYGESMSCISKRSLFYCHHQVLQQMKLCKDFRTLTPVSNNSVVMAVDNCSSENFIKLRKRQTL